jgi:GrpB-like predicted nucleotidyltransferase (UPF0157 family)
MKMKLTVKTFDGWTSTQTLYVFEDLFLFILFVLREGKPTFYYVVSHGEKHEQFLTLREALKKYNKLLSKLE